MQFNSEATLVQSNGGGVDSEALRLELKRRGMVFESVFCDHGGDLPETYDFIKYLLTKGEKITILTPRRDDLNIYDYHFKHTILPMIKYRSCTDHFKIRPMARYYRPKKPYINFIGYDADEKQRVQQSTLKGVEYQYPLIEWGLHRRDCEKIVADAHGDNKPCKSGCFFCPFQDRTQWWDLGKRHPDLFWKAVALEENSRMRYFRKAKTRYQPHLRDLWPPPSSFEIVDTTCNRCVFGLPLATHIGGSSV